MAFVPEGQADSSQARSAWVEKGAVPEGRSKSSQSQRYLSSKLSSCRFRNASQVGPIVFDPGTEMLWVY